MQFNSVCLQMPRVLWTITAYTNTQYAFAWSLVWARGGLIADTLCRRQRVSTPRTALLL